jgi:hypothetical protein
MLAGKCRKVILDLRSQCQNSSAPFIELELRSRASWPSTALEDVAQIIGGRIRTAISGFSGASHRPHGEGLPTVFKASETWRAAAL